MTDKAREEFEVWFKYNYQWFIKQGLVVYGLERSKDPLNHYANPIPNHDYRVWLASREAIEIELPSIQCVELHSYSHRDVLAYCEKAIMAAGLKVKP